MPSSPSLEVLVDALDHRLSALVVCLSHSWGGLEQVAARDAIEVGALGLDVQVLCLQNSPVHKHLSTRKEVSAVPIDYRPRNNFDFKLRTELERFCSNGTNLIHTHQTSLLGSIVPWIWGRPNVAVIASRHIMNSHNKRDFFHRAIYRRIDAFLVMSQALRRNVLETHALAEKRVKVVHLGLDFDVFDPAKVDADRQRREWGADPETVVIGMVGRIDPAKGQEVFVKAAAGLLGNRKPDEKLKFVIVGEETLGGESTYLAELKKIVAQFRLEDSVVFAGFQKNIPEVMRALDIFVMPSRQEAFGLVAIEAMAMETPVIISQGGSAEEIVGPNQSFGRLVRPDDAFDLQRQVRELLDRPEVRKEMGRKAREHVHNGFDRKSRLLRTLEVYEAALRRRQAL
jgi:glycosyltransferase involved in cell wall biosynthesis